MEKLRLFFGTVQENKKEDRDRILRLLRDIGGSLGEGEDPLTCFVSEEDTPYEEALAESALCLFFLSEPLGERQKDELAASLAAPCRTVVFCLAFEENAIFSALPTRESELIKIVYEQSDSLGFDVMALLCEQEPAFLAPIDAPYRIAETEAGCKEAIARSAGEPVCALAYATLGKLCQRAERCAEAADAFSEAQKLYFALKEGGTDAFERDRALVLQELSDACFRTRRYEESEQQLVDAKAILADLAARNEDRYGLDYCKACHRLAVFYRAMYDAATAEQGLTELLALIDAKAERARYTELLLQAKLDLALLLSEAERYEESYALLLQALEEAQRITAVAFLFPIYNALSRVCRARKEKIEAERYLKEAVKLGEAQEGDSGVDALLEAYDAINAFYREEDRGFDAECMYIKMIEVYQRKAAADPDRYAGELAARYGRLAEVQHYKDGARSLLSAIEILLPLMNKDPDTYTEPLASAMHRLGLLLQMAGRGDKAKKYLENALKLFRVLDSKGLYSYQSEITELERALARIS